MTKPRLMQIVRTAPSPDPWDRFWGIGQVVGPIGEPFVADGPLAGHSGSCAKVTTATVTGQIVACTCELAK